MRTLLPFLALLVLVTVAYANPLERQRRNLFDVAEFLWESTKDAGDSAGKGLRDWWGRLRDRFEDESDGTSVSDHFKEAGRKAKERLEKWMDDVKDWLNERSGRRQGEGEGTTYEIIRTQPWSDDDDDDQDEQSPSLWEDDDDDDDDQQQRRPRPYINP